MRKYAPKRNDATLQIRLPSWQLAELGAAAAKLSKHELGGRRLSVSSFIRQAMHDIVQDTFLKYGEPEAEELQGRHED